MPVTLFVYTILFFPVIYLFFWYSVIWNIHPLSLSEDLSLRNEYRPVLSADLHLWCSLSWFSPLIIYWSLIALCFLWKTFKVCVINLLVKNISHLLHWKPFWEQFIHKFLWKCGTTQVMFLSMHYLLGMYWWLHFNLLRNIWHPSSFLREFRISHLLKGLFTNPQHYFSTT